MKPQLYRLNLTRDSHEALVRMTDKVNQDFVGGRVAKHELAAWILTKFEANLERNLPAIRRSHFDDVAYMQAILQQKKNAEKDGNPCPQFDQLAALIGAKISKSKSANVGKKPKQDASQVAEIEGDNE